MGYKEKCPLAMTIGGPSVETSRGSRPGSGGPVAAAVEMSEANGLFFSGILSTLKNGDAIWKVQAHHPIPFDPMPFHALSLSSGVFSLGLRNSVKSAGSAPDGNVP